MQTLLNLLQELRVSADFPHLENPMIFVSAFDQPIVDLQQMRQLLDRDALIAEEIVSFPHQKNPTGMTELLPVWQAIEFIRSIRDYCG